MREITICILFLKRYLKYLNSLTHPKMKSPLTGSFQKNYLNEENESFVMAPANINGGHGLPFDCCGVEKKL